MNVKRLSTNSLEELRDMYYRMLAILEDEYSHVSENAPSTLSKGIKKEIDKINKELDF